jgi:hypothetical protein
VKPVNYDLQAITTRRKPTATLAHQHTIYQWTGLVLAMAHGRRAEEKNATAAPPPHSTTAADRRALRPRASAAGVAKVTVAVVVA